MGLDLEFLFGQAEAEDFDRATIGGNQAGEHPDGGGLARAVGAEEAEEGATRDFEIHAIDGGFQTIKLPEVVDQDSGGHCIQCNWSSVPSNSYNRSLTVAALRQVSEPRA